MSKKQYDKASDVTREFAENVRALADAGDEWFLSLGRSLRGLVSVGKGGTSILGDSARAAAQTTGRITGGMLDRVRGDKAAPPVDVAPLLDKLAQYSTESVESLKGNTDFWLLIERLARVPASARSNAEKSEQADAPEPEVKARAKKKPGNKAAEKSEDKPESKAADEETPPDETLADTSDEGEADEGDE